MIHLKTVNSGKLLFLLMLHLSYPTLCSSNNYVKITVKGGQSLQYLYKKYGITYNQCNLTHFKELNNLKSVNKLLIGKEYNLPIVKLNYNGKSMATSVKGITKESALRLINYNKQVFSKKVKPTLYTKSKQIWAPYDVLECGKLLSTAKPTKTNQVAKLVKSKTSTAVSNPKVAIETKSLNIAPIKSESKIEVIRESKTELSTSDFESTSSSIRTKRVPVFGPDFEEIRIERNTLNKKVYYLVSGHGGPDPGTMYKGKDMTLCEDEYAYDVTLRLARKLMEHGAEVHLIVQDPTDGIRNETLLEMDKDEKCITGYPLVLNQRLRLTQTTDATNDLFRKYQKKGIADKDQLAIHIHIDSQNEDKRKDVYFYYQENNKTSATIAKRLQNTLDKKYTEISGREYTGTISSRNLFVMRNTIPSTVFMELGNIQNQNDHKRIIYPNNRQALAEWLFDGITGEE